jgi:hypothetical protein
VLYTYHFFFFFWGSNNRTFASTVVQLQAKSLKKCWNSNFFFFYVRYLYGINRAKVFSSNPISIIYFIFQLNILLVGFYL